MHSLFFVVVQGRAAADAAFAVLDRGSSSFIDQPVLAAPGWWLLQASRPTAVAEELVAELSNGSTALVIQTGSADSGVVSVFEPGQLVMQAGFGLFEELAEFDEGMADAVAGQAAVDEWVGRHAPKKPSLAVRKRMWSDTQGVKGQEAAEALLRRWGWTIKGSDPAKLLDECQGLFSAHPPWVGETWVDWLSVRWVLGHGRDFLGMWDLDAPGPPVRRWPKTDEGRLAWRAAQDELVLWPILQQTRLPGTRRWIQLDVPSADTRSAFLHWNDGRVSLMSTSFERPLTYMVSEPGVAWLLPAYAEAVSIQGEHTFRGIAHRLRTIADAERVASGVLHSFLGRGWDPEAPSPWHPVPDEIPIDLLATWRWVREQTESD